MQQSSHVEDGSEPDDRRSLGDRDLPVLRCAHREPLEAVLCRRAPRGWAKCGREASGSWLKGGIVISPETRTGQRSMKPPRSAGAIPALPSSPATLTSIRTSVSGVPCFPSCSRADSVATEWIRRQTGSSCFTLRLCRLPMKSQANESPQRSLLRRQVLLAVLADEGHPGLGEDAHLLDPHVLGRRQQLDPVAGDLADALEVGPDALGLDAFDQARHLSPPRSRPGRPGARSGRRRGDGRRSGPLRSSCRARPPRPSRPRRRRASRARPRSGRGSGRERRPPAR